MWSNHQAADDFQLPRILAALADQHRLATVRYVAHSGESCCADIIQEAGLAITKSTFSHHLRILREAGVLTKRIQGTRGYTRLRKDDLDQRFPGLMDSIIAADASLAERREFPVARRTAGPRARRRRSRTARARPQPWRRTPETVSRTYCLVKTTWTVIVLFIDVMPSWFQVRPKSARLTSVSPSSTTLCPRPRRPARRRTPGGCGPRTVRAPLTVTPSADGVTCSDGERDVRGTLATSKKSAERRCSSRFLFLVSIDLAATVIVPLASPAADTVPVPVISRNTPLTVARPHMLLLFSPISGLAASRAQFPASFPSRSSSCSADDVRLPRLRHPASVSILLYMSKLF